MKLYYAPGASSLAVHIALREIGASFDGVAVDLARRTTADGANFFDISARGYVPLLQLDDGSRHSEAASLLQNVADLDPQQNLIGTNGSGRQLTVVEWLTFIATELHKAFSPWLWHNETADSTRQAVKDKLAVRFAELDALLTIVNWANFLALSLTPYPHVQAYLGRVSRRPHVQDALRAEGLVK